MSEMKNEVNGAVPAIKLPPAKVENAAPAVVDVATLSQADVDLNTSKVKLEAEKVKLQREQLELEKLLSDIERIRAEKSSSQYAHETVEDSLRFQKQSRQEHEEACNHRKGGEAITLLGGAPSNGSDGNNYALIQHTLTSGVIFRLCLRCARTWFPNDPDYKWAMRLPTRNSPSTGCPSPGLTRHPERVRMVSEIEHRPQVRNPEEQYNSGPAGY